MIRYSDVVVTAETGTLQSVGGASVLVRVSATSAPAEIYDLNGAVVPNPVTADSSGRFEFYCHTGIYDLVVSHPTITTYTQSLVKIGDGTLHVTDFGAVADGATNAAPAIQAALDYAATLTADSWTEAGFFALAVHLDGGTYSLSAPLVFRTESYSRITLTGGQLVADTAADWGDDGTGKPTHFLVEVTGTGIKGVDIRELNLQCRSVASGVLLDTQWGNTNFVTRCEITNFGAYGIHIASAGDNRLEGNTVTEWVNSQTEFTTEANYVATGIYVESNDNTLFQNVVRWCATTVKVDGGTCMISDNHFYNGGSGLLVRANPVLIDNSGWGNQYIGNYLDNGEIHLRGSKTAVFIGNLHLYLSNSVAVDGLFIIHAIQNNDTFDWLHISHAILPVEARNDAVPYILLRDDGFSFVDRASSFLLYGRSCDVEVSPRSKVFTRTGYISTRVAEFRGQMETALICAESSTSTDNFALPGFGAFGDQAVIATNGSSWFSVTPEGNVGIPGSDDVHRLTVRHGVRSLANFENTNADGSVDITLSGSRFDANTSVGQILITDKTYGDRAAFQGYTSGTSTAEGLAVICTAGASVLTNRWMVDGGGKFLPWTDNAYDIGSSGARVKDLYLVNAATVSSDERNKTDIADSDLGLAFIAALTPRKYRVIESAKTITGSAATQETVSVPVTRTETYTQVDVADGQPVQRTLTREVPVYDSLPVTDENGEPVLVTNEAGEQVALTRLVPRMQSVTRDVPAVEQTAVAGVRTHYGLVAQEVKAALDSLSVTSFAGWGMADPEDEESLQHLRYAQFIAPLIKAVQELAARVTALEGAP